MKKILITILFMLAAIGAYGQNKFKYPIQALGGLSIGNTADTAKIDSVIYSLGTLKFYRGSTEISVGGGSMTYPAAGIALSTGAAWGASITNNSTNWNTAYTDRLKWDGGNGDLVAATGRSSLGGTTVGQAFFTLTNPTAITFPRINADNTVTALSAANFKTALSLTSADVGLGNVTNKAQVEVEDSAAMLTPYIRAAEVSAAYSNKALSNLASVAINTHLLPATDGAVNLGSATYKWGNIFLDSAKVINFNNGDITATHSDNALTFAGGNIVLPSTTSIGDVSSTEIGYVNGVTSAIQTQLNALETRADSIVTVLADTANIETLLQIDFDTDTVATKAYARTYGGSGSVTIGDVRGEIADSLNALRPIAAATVTGYTPAGGSLTLSGADAITLTTTAATGVTLPTTGTLATTTQVALKADLTAVKLNVDTVGIFVFGAGSGAAADSTLFEMNDSNFGSFYNYTDTLYVVNFKVLYLTSGDSLRFNCYYGNRMTGVATDSLFNAIQAVGTDQNILTPNDRKIPPGADVWIKMSGTQLTGLRPKQFEIQLNGYTIRDH